MWFLSHMDKVIILITFFVGLNNSDIYHLGLLVFFLCYILYPRCMKKTFLFFQLYVQFFVLSHYIYVVFRFYYTQGSDFDRWIRFFGIGTNYEASDSYFVFRPNISQWVLIFLTFLQMRIYLNQSDDEELSNR